MRPTTEEFEQYLPAFLVSNPVPKCAKGGHAAYAQVIEKITVPSPLSYVSTLRGVRLEISLSDSHMTTTCLLNYLFASTVVL
jgi:hypothetical protein